MSYQNPEKALLSLHRGDVDAMIGNTLVISYFSTRNNIFDEVTVVGKAFNKQNYAIAVAVDSTELLARLNKGIEAVQESGIYDQIYRKWFGVPVSSPTQNIGFVVAVAAGSILVIMSISYIYHRINWRLKAIIAEETAKEKAAMDKLREYDKLQFMDRIISSIAHEIRNPLTSIRFYAEQIPEKISDRKFMMAVAEDIPPEIERIDALIKEFIEYTVPRTPFQEAIFLKAALEQVLTFLHVQMRDIQVDMTVPPDLFILFDRNHLRQILLNILINSIDALEGVGDPRIIIHAAADGGMVVIEFFDNGGGSDEGRIPYLFDPFYTTKQSGNGLGLFIVRQMAEENGGCVFACNQAGGMMIRLSVLRQTPATP
ncbi:sensor histidine kinase [Oscillibacter sp.]|uniref:sensor histidine kinase n=1 Tax=Oscillibacter sp. TaxID=1945593 RepID=UPI0037CBCF9A